MVSGNIDKSEPGWPTKSVTTVVHLPCNWLLSLKLDKSSM